MSNNKKRLFEVMGKVDDSFKSKLNEDAESLTTYSSQIHRDIQKKLQPELIQKRLWSHASGMIGLYHYDYDNRDYEIDVRPASTGQWRDKWKQMDGEDKLKNFGLNESESYSEWNSLRHLMRKESFSREDMRVILYTIYKNVYMEDKQKLMELMDMFGWEIGEQVSESPMFGGEKVSQDMYDELQYDKSTMEKAYADAFATPPDYQLRNQVQAGQTIDLKDGDKVQIKSVDDNSKMINVRVFPADEMSKKYYRKGYFDITWSFKQFDMIVGN